MAEQAEEEAELARAAAAVKRLTAPEDLRGETTWQGSDTMSASMGMGANSASLSSVDDAVRKVGGCLCVCAEGAEGACVWGGGRGSGC